MVRETCSECGRRLNGDEPHGLCPSCLLQRAAFDDTMERPERQCSKCSATLADDARFCALCGAPAPAMAHGSEDALRHALEAKLGGQYRVLRLLGRGGMGAVYLARDLTLEREVAIKVVKPASDTPAMYDRFRREAKTAAKLSHPNIVPLHAFGEVDGMPYFVMGYVRGESLAERMRRDGKLPEEDARRIIAEIADALDHAHRQGVVHRDVKPDNVLLEDASGRALLTDFGIARPMNPSESLTQHSSLVGTPH
ncbi:MAG TPA: serine/threonine-protein kinase, partial [Thermoanaerobaculia bacterium]|nr:serine/threonine-protein kinase [Thermoanaerobaculia bacterium]